MWKILFYFIFFVINLPKLGLYVELLSNMYCIGGLEHVLFNDLIPSTTLN